MVRSGGEDSPSTSGTGQAAEQTTFEVSGGIEAFRFDPASVQESASVVAVGEVVGETEHDAPPGQPDDDTVLSLRDVDFALDEVISGDVDAGQILTIVDLPGWAYRQNGARLEATDEGDTRLRPGDRALVVLVRESDLLADAPEYLLLTSESYLFLDADGGILQTKRSNSFVRELESKSAAQAIGELESLCVDGCDRAEFPTDDNQ